MVEECGGHPFIIYVCCFLNFNSKFFRFGLQRKPLEPLSRLIDLAGHATILTNQYP